MKISKLDFVIYALFLSVFKIFVIPTALQQTLKVAAIAMILFYLINRIHRKELLNISFWWAMIVIGTSFIGYFNNTISIESSLDSVLHGMCIYSLFTLTAYCSRTDNLKKLKDILFFVLIFYCGASLITVAMYGGGSGTSVYYFAGNKFRTGYYFILLLAMILIRYYNQINSKSRNKALFLLFTVMVMLLTRYIQCTTAFVAAVCVAAAVFVPKKLQRILKKPSTVIIALGVAAFLLLVTDIISENQLVSYIITNVLGKDVGLTGRFRIYSYVFRVIRGSWLFGYGYGNYAVGAMVGYGNAQNSVIQLVVDYGIIGLLGFIILMAYCFRKGSNTENRWGYYVYIYTMLVCSMVEICFNYNFYTMLFLICFDRDKTTLPYGTEKT